MNLINSIALAGFVVLMAHAVTRQSQFPGSAVGEKGHHHGSHEGPLSGIHAKVCGLHFYNGDMGRQVIAYHYCSHLSDDLMQCVIYDSDRKEARLIGIEYIISARLFTTLPEEEKQLWHSHNFEVKSGLLTAPGLPQEDEKKLMKTLVGTYGKTWHTWQIDRGDKLPLGIPQLMMGFTADGQARQSLVDERDRNDGSSTAEKKARRADIPDAAIETGANAWQKGPAVQLELKVVRTKPEATSR